MTCVFVKSSVTHHMEVVASQRVSGARCGAARARASLPPPGRHIYGQDGVRGGGDGGAAAGAQSRDELLVGGVKS